MADLTDLIERAWGGLSRWAVPVMMTLAYAFLAATSDTDLDGKLWMAAGLGLVLITWFAFRALSESAALSRALAVGDTAQLSELADRELARRRRPAARARFLVARGLVGLLRGDHAAALAALDAFGALDAARPPPELAGLAAALRITVLVELERGPEGGPALAALAGLASPAVLAPRAPWLAWLTDAELAWRRGDRAAAAPLLARVIDDVRAGSALRAIAHVYAARIAGAGGDARAAARHRAAAAELAAPDAAWLRA